MPHAALLEIRRTWREIDHREPGLLSERCRRIVALASVLEADAPGEYRRYQAEAAARQAVAEAELARREQRDRRTHHPCGPVQCVAAAPGVRTGRTAARRRRVASIRGWCIQSRIHAIQDLTDTQCAVLVELLRRCCKTATRTVYLTHAQLADAAGCSVSSVKTAVRLFKRRGLVLVRGRRLGRHLNAPNLYRPLALLLNALAPLIAPARAGRPVARAGGGIGGQNSAPLCSRENTNTPTNTPTARERGRTIAGGRTTNGGEWNEARAGRPSGLSGEALALSRRALSHLTGAAPPDGAGALAAVETLTPRLLPGLSEADWAGAVRRLGAGAHVAVLATALKAAVRTDRPIRSPARYFLGTIWRRGRRPDPLASLRACIAAHDACAAPRDIAVAGLAATAEPGRMR